MSDEMGFGFGEDAQIVKRTARRFFAEQCPPDRLHRRVAVEGGWDEAAWRQAVELGWLAAGVPDAAGGFGMGVAACVGLMEEVGRAAFPGPLGPTLWSTALLAAGDAGGAWLRWIADGHAMSPGVVDRDGALDGPATVWARVDESGAVRLDGTAWWVQDAGKVEAFVVRAAGPAGEGLYVVEADAPGLERAGDMIWDLTRDQARLELRGVEVTPDAIVAAPGRAAAAVRAAEPTMLVLLAADMVGAAEWQLQTTAEYARTRTQFGRPIGFFQAVKHPLVDVMVLVDEARSLLYDAAAAIDRGAADAEVVARMAKAAAGEAATYASSRSVQLHGGIGFTWECFVHVWFKRQAHSAVLFGDAARQRARIAEALVGPIGGVAA